MFVQLVTRAVRVIDTLTTYEGQNFQSSTGLHAFVERVNLEVEKCRIEQPYEIKLVAPDGGSASAVSVLSYIDIHLCLSLLLHTYTGFGDI